MILKTFTAYALSIATLITAVAMFQILLSFTFYHGYKTKLRFIKTSPLLQKGKEEDD